MYKRGTQKPAVLREAVFLLFANNWIVWRKWPVTHKPGLRLNYTYLVTLFKLSAGAVGHDLDYNLGLCFCGEINSMK